MAQTQIHNMEWGEEGGAPDPRPGRRPSALVQPRGGGGRGAEKGGAQGPPGLGACGAG